MDKLHIKANTIFKQPSFRIKDMLLKEDNNIDVSSDEIKYMLKDIGSFFKLLEDTNLHIFIVIDYYKVGDINKHILASRVINEVEELSRKDLSIHYLDKDCHLIESKSLNEVISDELETQDERYSSEVISELSDVFSATFIYGNSSKYDIFHNGKLIKPACGIDFNYIPNQIFSCIKPISKYKELVEDHFKQCVKYSQATDHWANKERRILRSSPEDIFKNSLWYYLYMFSEDANDVIAEYPLRSGNRIDICVQAHDSKIYFFEVKVLGKYFSQNDKGYQEYRDDRVHHGLNQSIIYINELKDNFIDVEYAELVIYDARETQENIDITDNERHEKVGEPHYLYLESKNATKKAKEKTSARKSS